MTDVLDDENFRMAYVYFQQFLETKSLSEMLYLWHTVLAASSETESSLKQSSADTSNVSYCHDYDEENFSSSPSRKLQTGTSGRSSPAVQLPSSAVEVNCVSADSYCDNANNNDCLEIAATATTVTTPSSANEIFFKFSDVIRQRIQSKTVHARGASNRSSLSSTTTPTDEKLTAPFSDVDALKIAVHETLLE